MNDQHVAIAKRKFNYYFDAVSNWHWTLDNQSEINAAIDDIVQTAVLQAEARFEARIAELEQLVAKLKPGL